MTLPARPLMTALVLLALAAAGPMNAAFAESDDDEGVWSDQDRARDLREQGRIKPLDEILAELAKSRPGEVVSVDLESEGGRWVYEVKILSPGGKRIDVNIDAATGAIIADGAE
jgi:uncharacterized membrane protein YkoI